MRKMFVVLFASIICLSGCFMPKAMYEQADADQVTAKNKRNDADIACGTYAERGFS